MAVKSRDELDRYYQMLNNTIDIVEENNDFAAEFYRNFLVGDRTFYQKDITETKVFDEEWITTMESYFGSIDAIINNPVSTIRYDEDVVEIEKARKINSMSVRHLASHTQFMKSVSSTGDVIPKKILTTHAETEYITYENRFLKTLIDRLVIFVTNRYNIIKENVESYNKNHLNLTSEFNIKDTTVNINIDMVVKKQINNTNEKRNMELLKRVEKLNKMVLSFKGSQLMKSLASSNKVVPPIMQTNIISKNTNFKNCYLLWLFLDRYNSLCFDLNVKEVSKKVTPQIDKDFNHLALMTYLFGENNNNNRRTKFGQSKEVDEIVKKSTRTVKNIPDDFVERPDAIELESNGINEYYFQQFKQMMKKTYSENKKESSTEDVALKKTIRDINSITNTLYSSYFELEEKEDIFTKLVKKEDPKANFEEAKKKANIAKIIREAREVEYNEALRQEKRLAKEMDTASTKIINQLLEQKNTAAEEKLKKEIALQMEMYKKAKEDSKTKIVTLDGKKVKVQKEKESAAKRIKDINLKLRAEILRINQLEKERSKQAISDLKKEHAQRVKEIIAREKENAEKLILEEKEKLEKAKATFALKVKQEKEKAALRRKEEENKIKEALKKKEKEAQDLEKEKAKAKANEIRKAKNNLAKNKKVKGEVLEPVSPEEKKETVTPVLIEEEKQVKENETVTSVPEEIKENDFLGKKEEVIKREKAKKKPDASVKKKPDAVKPKPVQKTALAKDIEKELLQEKVTLAEAKQVITDAVAETLIAKVIHHEDENEKDTRGNKKSVINVDTLSKNYNPNDEVTLESLIEKGLVSPKTGSIKVLARGTLDKPLTVVADDFSLDAVKMIAITGGSVVKK